MYQWLYSLIKYIFLTWLRGKGRRKNKEREKGKHGSQIVQWEYMASGPAELLYMKVMSILCETSDGNDNSEVGSTLSIA
jgi:hypothetical protein